MPIAEEMEVQPTFDSGDGVWHGDCPGTKGSVGALLGTNPSSNSNRIGQHSFLGGIYIETATFLCFSLQDVPEIATVKYAAVQFVPDSNPVVNGPRGKYGVGTLLADGKWDQSGGFYASDYVNQGQLPHATAENSDAIIPGRIFFNNFNQIVTYTSSDHQAGSITSFGDPGYPGRTLTHPAAANGLGTLVQAARNVGYNFFSLVLDPYSLPSGSIAEHTSYRSMDGASVGDTRLLLYYEAPFDRVCSGGASASSATTATSRTSPAVDAGSTIERSVSSSSESFPGVKSRGSALVSTVAAGLEIEEC